MTAAARPDSPASTIVELRRYTLNPGSRDTLVNLFEREFVESQEEAGMQILATFRDVDRPDIFVWMRGFPDMPARARSLEAFYSGPVWHAHRDAANATMIDWRDVRLLHPVGNESGFIFDGERAAPGATAIPAGLFVATIYTLSDEASGSFAGLFDRTIAPRLVASGARPIAVFETESSANTFPQLPVRERERVFLWLARYADLAEHDRAVVALASDRLWTEEVLPSLERIIREPAETWRLTPTARSRIPGISWQPSGTRSPFP